jgi:hypothetical protein
MSLSSSTPDPWPGPSPQAPLPQEIEEEQIIDLPSRHALTIVDPGIFGFGNPLPIGRPTVPVDTGQPTPAST